jgi:DNA-binding IclR family transcriptional regulator
LGRTGYRIGVKSIDVGMDLVFKLAQTQQPMSLKEISGAAKMSPGKAHRYLISFLRTGIVSQSPDTHLYELGPTAMHLGLVAMGRSSIIDQATRLSISMRDEVGETTVLTVWGNNGPTVVHVENNHDTIVVTVRVGTVLPIIDSAAGRVFAAFQSAADVEPVLEQEFVRIAQASPNDAAVREQFDKDLVNIRKRRQSLISGARPLGVSAISSPLMFPRDNLVAVLTIIGRSERMAKGLDGPIAKTLRTAAERFPLSASSTPHARAFIANP